MRFFFFSEVLTPAARVKEGTSSSSAAELVQKKEGTSAKNSTSLKKFCAIFWIKVVFFQGLRLIHGLEI